MKSTVKVGKTVEEAVEKALKALNADEAEVEIKILEEPKAGLFGLIGAKDAVVEVSIIEEEDFTPEPEIVDTTVVETTTKEDFEEVRENAPVIENNAAEHIVVEEITLEEAAAMEEAPAEEFESDDFNTQKAETFLIEVLDKMNIKADVESQYMDHALSLKIVGIDERDTGIIIGRHGETLDALQYLVNLVANRHADHYIRVSLDVNNYREKRVKSLENLAHSMARKAKKYKKNMRLEPMNPYERRIIHSTLQNVSQITTTSDGEEPYRRVIIKYIRKNK